MTGSSQVPDGGALGAVLDEAHPDHHGPDHHQPDQHEPDQYQPDQHGPDHHDPDQYQPDQHEPDHVGPDQHEPDQHEPDRIALDGPQWRALADTHAAAVDELTREHRLRASVHAPHPVADFLFTYYSLRPAQLARWHPGLGVDLRDAGERSDWRFYHAVGEVVRVDGPRLLRERARMIDFVDRLLAHTAVATPQFGCFGLHEWAMVYRQTPEQIRHADWPLRLGPAGTDDVVRTHTVRCSHYDAFRFFTPQARPLNRLAPDIDSRDRMEQPGCLHATMDLYKWAYKLGPAVPGELLLDCFRLAREVRELDMRASPYDLTELGYSPVAVETAEGKAEYVAAQRNFAERGAALRERLRTVLAALRSDLPVDPPTGRLPGSQSSSTWRRRRGGTEPP